MAIRAVRSSLAVTTGVPSGMTWACARRRDPGDVHRLALVVWSVRERWSAVIGDDYSCWRGRRAQAHGRAPRLCRVPVVSPMPYSTTFKRSSAERIGGSMRSRAAAPASSWLGRARTSRSAIATALQRGEDFELGDHDGVAAVGRGAGVELVGTGETSISIRDGVASAARTSNSAIVHRERVLPALGVEVKVLGDVVGEPPEPRAPGRAGGRHRRRDRRAALPRGTGPGEVARSWVPHRRRRLEHRRKLEGDVDQ